MQVGLLAGLWEPSLSADLEERESVVAWEAGKEQGLKSPDAGKSTAISPSSAGLLLPGALL